MSALVLASLSLQTPPLREPATLTSRRGVLVTTGAALLLPAAVVHAFDLPPRAGAAAAVSPYDPTFEDAEARRRYAAMANPEMSKQQNAAFYAVTIGDMESLQAMADGGWALAEIADDSGKTLLHRAAQVDNESAVKLLLKMGSPLDPYTSFKETPLHLAVRNNRLACVKLLVEAGASTSAPYSKSGETALALATKYRFDSVAEYLKSKSAP